MDDPKQLLVKLNSLSSELFSMVEQGTDTNSAWRRAIELRKLAGFLVDVLRETMAAKIAKDS